MPGYDADYSEYFGMYPYGEYADYNTYYTPSETEMYYTGGFPPVEPIYKGGFPPIEPIDPIYKGGFPPIEPIELHTGGFPPIEPMELRPVVTPEQAVSASEALMTPRYINTPRTQTDDNLYQLMYTNGVPN